MSGFRVKLVLWFGLLALVPLLVAFYGYETLAKRSETRRVDEGLESALRGAVAGYATRLDAAASQASQLAADPRVGRALRERRRLTLTLLAARVPGAVVNGGGIHAGRTLPLAAVRTVTVVSGKRVVGEVSIQVPIDRRLLTRLSAGLASGDVLLAVRDDRVVAGRHAGAELAVVPGNIVPLHFGGVAYRTLSTAPLSEPQGLVFTALAPQSSIEAGARASERGLAEALAASFALLAVFAFLLGRSIVTRLRSLATVADAIADGRLDERAAVGGHDELAHLGHAFNRMAAQLEQRQRELEVARIRMQAANARLGDALAFTHDPEQLLRIVVEAAVAAAGARGGEVSGPDGVVARVGEPDAEGERVILPLSAGASDFGDLVLASPALGPEGIETARSLAAQAVVALDNARRHRVVSRLALVDPATGLANRRSADERLRSELARADRTGEGVCLVLADLDDFAELNERHGRELADELLREVGRGLRATMRASDLAARWDDEAFALVLPGTDLRGGVALADRTRAIVEALAVAGADGGEVHVTCSFGVASYPESGDLKSLVETAEAALAAAKRDGKNRVVTLATGSGPRMV